MFEWAVGAVVHASPAADPHTRRQRPDTVQPVETRERMRNRLVNESEPTTADVTAPYRSADAIRTRTTSQRATRRLLALHLGSVEPYENGDEAS